jgi:hypothetical protein
VVVSINDRRRVPSGRDNVKNGSIVGARVERPRGGIDSGRVRVRVGRCDVAVVVCRRNNPSEDMMSVGMSVSVVSPCGELSTPVGTTAERFDRGADTFASGVASRVSGVDSVRK